MQRNNIRFDLSDYLIHFFRDVDLESNEYILLPEHCGFNNIHHHSRIDALYLLRCALRNKKISASWSYRGNKRTIYGESPAICFTDMPLAAFIKSSQERMERGENIGQYALMLSKKDMFRVGARPVIYALDGMPNTLLCSLTSDEERIINPDLLPIQEQYRYVTYSPVGVDWSHEREWRWPCRDNLHKYYSDINEYGGVIDIKDSPGLKLNKFRFFEAGVIVKNTVDIEPIIHDILTLVDQKKVLKDSFKFIISLDKLSSYSNIIDPVELSELFNRNIINLGFYTYIEENRVKEINEDVTKIIDIKLASFYPDNTNGFGKSWVWLLDNKSEVTRALIRSGKVTVNKEGRYLLDLGESISIYSLKDQEKITQQVYKELIAQYGLNASYFSVLNTHDPDGIPYYSGDIDDNHIFYNSTVEIDW